MASTVDPLAELLETRRQECMDTLNVTAPTVSGLYCPGTWDGWMCWPDTAAGTSAYKLCPDFVTGFDPSRKYEIEVDF
jgi:Hormone receptor domain